MDYAIKAAQESQLFEDIVVSTDSEKIATIANECGAATPFLRPPELADDFAGTRLLSMPLMYWQNRAGTTILFAAFMPLIRCCNATQLFRVLNCYYRANAIM
jgi:CMP-N-acetylneuraminic acid synthetase